MTKLYFSKSVLCIFIKLFVTPFLSAGQTISNPALTPKQINLSGKTFAVGDNKTGHKLNLYLIFHQDGRAAFRGKKGNILSKENPLRWWFVKDSLYIQNGPVDITAEGVITELDREPMKYIIEKVPGGYLLKDKDSQIRLFELK